MRETRYHCHIRIWEWTIGE
ncbi:hypothetical protein LINPERPRIM_LOCUS7607 [Linum perenne]